MEKKEEQTLSRWVTYDDTVCERACRVHMIILTGDAVGEADVTIRNGHDTGGEVMLKIRAYDNESHCCVFVKPVKFDKGLFVDIGTNVDGVFVQYSIKGKV